MYAINGANIYGESNRGNMGCHRRRCGVGLVPKYCTRTYAIRYDTVIRMQHYVFNHVFSLFIHNLSNAANVNMM